MDFQKLAKEFKEKGYLELRGFFTRQECEALLATMGTAQQCERGRGRLNDQGLTFNHNLYYHNPPIQQFITQKKIIDLLTPIAGPDIWIRWDQLVSKKLGGVEFPWHQDNGYNGLKDEHYQFWIALSPSNAENGGLWLVPGSHKNGVAPHIWVGKHKVAQGVDESKEIAISAQTGDAVLFSSLMMHRTKLSTVNIDRHAYVVEYMSAKKYDPYLEAPFFMVSKNGVPSVGFADNYPGRRNPLNHLKYAPSFPQLAKRAIKRLVPSS